MVLWSFCSYSWKKESKDWFKNQEMYYGWLQQHKWLCSENENKIIVSRYVIFSENIFPEKQNIVDRHIIRDMACPKPNDIIQYIKKISNEE